jgi:Tol biopolymer transport system component
MTVPALGAAPEREIARIEGVKDSEFVAPLLAWSADGKYLFSVEREAASSTSRFTIVRITVDDGSKTKVTAPPGGSYGDDSPAVSPDGRSLAFRRIVTGHSISDLFVIGLKDELAPPPEPQRITFDRSWIDGYAWVNDREMILLSDRSGRTEPWRVAAFDPRSL